jgi:hypothetical protein
MFGKDVSPSNAFLRRQYSELPKQKRVVVVNSLSGNPIVIVKRKDGAKRKLRSSPGRGNSAPFIHMGAANNHFQYDRLIANMPLRHVDVEVGKALK